MEKSANKASTILPESDGFIVRLNPALTAEAVRLHHFRTWRWFKSLLPLAADDVSLLSDTMIAAALTD